MSALDKAKKELRDAVMSDRAAGIPWAATDVIPTALLLGYTSAILDAKKREEAPDGEAAARKLAGDSYDKRLAEHEEGLDDGGFNFRREYPSRQVYVEEWWEERYLPRVLKLQRRIFATIDDLAGELLYYGRKEDAELPVGAIEEAVLSGLVSVDAICARFRRLLAKTVEGERLRQKEANRGQR